MENENKPQTTLEKIDAQNENRKNNYTKIAVVAAGVSATVALGSVGLEKVATGHMNRMANEGKNQPIENKVQNMPSQNIDLNKPVDINQIKQDKPNPETFGTKVSPKDIK